MASDPIRLETPRRRDRMQGESWIRAVLHQSGFGYLATAADDRPALHPNLFVFDEERDAIYLHTARRGETRTRVGTGVPVAFAVGEMGRILPARAAIDFSVEYASVVLTGSARVLEDRSEASRALELLLRKYAPHLAPGVDYRAIDGSDLDRTTVYRIDIDSWSGKRNHAPDGATTLDFPASKSGGGETTSTDRAASDSAAESRWTTFHRALARAFRGAFHAALPTRGRVSEGGRE